MHLRKGIRPAIVGIWLIAMAIFIRFEAYPILFTRTVPGYRGLITDALMARENWSRILIEGEPAGYIHTTLTLNDDEPIPVLEWATRVQMRVRILNTVQRITLLSDLTLDQDYEPISFSMFAAAGDFTLRITGQHESERRYTITTETADTVTTRTIEIPRDTVIYSPISELAVQQLRPGRALVIRTLDPLTLQPAAIHITAGTRETIRIGTREMRAMPLRSVWQGMELRSWIDDQGMILRQETPFGWVIEAATPEAALATLAEDQQPPALLRSRGGTASLLQTILGGRLTP